MTSRRLRPNHRREQETKVTKCPSDHVKPTMPDHIFGPECATSHSAWSVRANGGKSNPVNATFDAKAGIPLLLPTFPNLQNSNGPIRLHHAARRQGRAAEAPNSQGYFA